MTERESKRDCNLECTGPPEEAPTLSQGFVGQASGSSQDAAFYSLRILRLMAHVRSPTLVETRRDRQAAEPCRLRSGAVRHRPSASRRASINRPRSEPSDAGMTAPDMASLHRVRASHCDGKRQIAALALWGSTPLEMCRETMLCCRNHNPGLLLSRSTEQSRSFPDDCALCPIGH